MKIGWCWIKKIDVIAQFTFFITTQFISWFMLDPNVRKQVWKIFKWFTYFITSLVCLFLSYVRCSARSWEDNAGLPNYDYHGQYNLWACTGYLNVPTILFINNSIRLNKITARIKNEKECQPLFVICSNWAFLIFFFSTMENAHFWNRFLCRFFAKFFVLHMHECIISSSHLSYEDFDM